MSKARLAGLIATMVLAAWWALVVVDWDSYWRAITGGP